jgi:hypothetical protein
VPPIAEPVTPPAAPPPAAAPVTPPVLLTPPVPPDQWVPLGLPASTAASLPEPDPPAVQARPVAPPPAPPAPPAPATPAPARAPAAGLPELPPLGGPPAPPPLTFLGATTGPASRGWPAATGGSASRHGNPATLVVARTCPNGHFNPPWATTCRNCHQPIPAQPLREVQRPSLGILRLSSGGTVTLDRGAVFGRNPKVTPQVGRLPRLIRIADPNRDISSQHLEVRLDEWLVTVIDLGSTNGTQVTPPGQGPTTLRPHEPLAIDPGTRVTLARAFQFVYEIPA